MFLHVHDFLFRLWQGQELKRKKEWDVYKNVAALSTLAMTVRWINDLKCKTNVYVTVQQQKNNDNDNWHTNSTDSEKRRREYQNRNRNMPWIEQSILFIQLQHVFCEFPLKSISLEKLSNAMNFPFIYWTTDEYVLGVWVSRAHPFSVLISIEITLLFSFSNNWLSLITCSNHILYAFSFRPQIRRTFWRQPDKSAWVNAESYMHWKECIVVAWVHPIIACLPFYTMVLVAN